MKLVISYKLSLIEKETKKLKLSLYFHMWKISFLFKTICDLQLLPKNMSTVHTLLWWQPSSFDILVFQQTWRLIKKCQRNQVTFSQHCKNTNQEQLFEQTGHFLKEQLLDKVIPGLFPFAKMKV